MTIEDFHKACRAAERRGATHVSAIVGGSLMFSRGDDLALVIVDFDGQLTIPVNPQPILSQVSTNQ